MNDFNISINKSAMIEQIEKAYTKRDIPKLFVGDTVKLGVVIREGNKERTQYYEGIIIGQRHSGLNKTIIVRKVMQGVGIERIFLINSPKLVSIDIKKSSRVRRSKLYYLRKLSGKASRLKQRFD